jgi:hypothetical protein
MRVFAIVALFLACVMAAVSAAGDVTSLQIGVLVRHKEEGVAAKRGANESKRLSRNGERTSPAGHVRAPHAARGHSALGSGTVASFTHKWGWKSGRAVERAPACLCFLSVARRVPNRFARAPLVPRTPPLPCQPCGALCTLVSYTPNKKTS